MKSWQLLKTSALCSLSVAILSACGGGGGNDPDYFGGGNTDKNTDNDKVVVDEQGNLAPLNQAPATVKKFLTDMNDQGQQTKNIVALVDHNSNQKIDAADKISSNQPGIISEICTNCAGMDQFNADIEALYKPKLNQLNAALNSATSDAEKARIQTEIDAYEKHMEDRKMKPGIVYMRDINNQFHTAHISGSVDYNDIKNPNDPNYNRLIAQDAGIRKIDGEWVTKNGQRVKEMRGGVINKAFNGVTTFSADANSSGNARVLDAYLRDPAAIGWSYNTFGVFESAGLTQLRDIHRGYQSIGVNATNLPGKGKASYTGISHAYYNNDQVTMNVKIDANFAERKLDLTTSNATLHTFESDQHMIESKADLNLKGSANWVEGNGNFTGSIENTGGNLKGSMEGSFYGPLAAEVGGVYGLSGKDGNNEVRYIGGFGAKRP